MAVLSNLTEVLLKWMQLNDNKMVLDNRTNNDINDKKKRKEQKKFTTKRKKWRHDVLIPLHGNSGKIYL